MESVLSNYASAIKQAITEITQEEQDKAQETARGMDNGWSELADQIKVQYNHEDRELKYSVEGGGLKAQSLEFGDESNAPTPVLRKHAAMSKDDFNKRVADRAYELLGKASK
jgi:hypothetical protein